MCLSRRSHFGARTWWSKARFLLQALFPPSARRLGASTRIFLSPILPPCLMFSNLPSLSPLPHLVDRSVWCLGGAACSSGNFRGHFLFRFLPDAGNRHSRRIGCFVADHPEHGLTGGSEDRWRRFGCRQHPCPGACTVLKKSALRRWRG